jgi:hypothetical protein
MITEAVYRKESRAGSYERGFKFTTTEYKMLEQGTGWNKEYSLDGGKTWAHSEYLAWKASDRKDRVKLNSTRRGELAFDAIQKINREYHGPGYKWHA